MNREFISKYFDLTYDELMTTRDGHDDPGTKDASRKSAEAEKELMALCGGMDTELWEAYEKCVDAKAEEYHFLLRAMYLAGAEDCEKMMR